jgi:alpha-ribazole phosphatase
MTKIFFIRHGETVWNKELKYQGHTDILLSDVGLRQAKLVADRLAGEKIDAVYASDLRRAFITAENIAARHNLPVTAVPELREIQFGEWEGLTYEGINQRWPNEYDQLFHRTDEVRIPGGETFRELKERAAGAVAGLVARHPGETIAVVSHGGTIRTIICAALNIHLNHVWDIRQDNTAVNVIEYYDRRAIITLLNDIHHLQPQG